ncbi:hypothetical protein [Agromyces aerolatus]|uniref:hypothetical protein n=1 Tax=Agromyces sp. LY-1074 TaxID=3074080 RepID=UPI00285D175C|nr:MULTISPECIES: hypothetical protein [unclassified Agromyces]MDR5701938.1 hypothetical protein [Agromyces sp. LY-1074]MDR5708165.1 hypothetical protein [Agromyces sp. LY-1358]
MSSETVEPAELLDPADPAAPSTTASRRFRRGLLGTIAVLAAAAVSLAFAGVVQGPRLAEASVDVERVTRLADGRLVLAMNQPVARVEGDVRVEPEAPATLTIDGRSLVVEFAEPLPYDTEFTVAVDGVVGEAQPTAVSVEHRFTTADAPVYTLARRSADGQPDVVLRSSFAERTPAVVVEAPRLQAFAHAGDAVVAVAIEDDETNTLRIAGLDETTQTMGLPEPGVVRSIGGSTTHPLIAFVHDGVTLPGGAEPAFRETLFTLDVSGAAAAPEPVLGIDGEPLRVMDWRFVPGTTSLVVQDLDGALFVVDALGLTPPTPLGSAAELRGLLPGSRLLVVADPDRGRIFDLETGDELPNDLPVAELPEQAYPGRVTQLDAAGAHVLSVLLTGGDGAGGVAMESLLARVDGEGTTLRYATGENSRLLEYCVAPNGRYATIETVSVDARADGYPHDPSYLDRLTTVVDLDSGDVVLTQSGGSSDWCR